jgi:flagellar hook-basal body complex protein FliE
MKVKQSILDAGYLGGIRDQATGIRGNLLHREKRFSDMLKTSVERVNALQKQADIAIDDLVLGSNKDIVQTVIMMEKADISFRLMMQVRNKIIQADEEIMRTQV